MEEATTKPSEDEIKFDEVHAYILIERTVPAMCSQKPKNLGCTFTVRVHTHGDTMGIQYSLVNLVWGTVFTSEYCTLYSIHWWLWGCHIVWGVRYSLVNNVYEVRYSLGCRIHSDTVPNCSQFLQKKFYP